MKKSLIYLFSLLCMLTLATSCSDDDEKGGTDEAWKELSKDYTAENLSIGTVSTSGTVSVNATSADKATIALNNVVAGESSVSVDATLTKTETGYAFEGESAATTCNVKVSGTIENGKLTAAISRTLTSALAGTMELNFIPSTGEGLMAQTYAYFNTGNEQMDAMLNGMAAPVLGQLIAQQVESVSVNLGEDGIFSFSFKKVGSSETTVMPPANLAAMINSYLTWFEKDDVLYLASVFDDKFRNGVYLNKGKLEYLKSRILKGMLFDPMRKAESMLFYQVGMPGNPTVYFGDEIGETGWETPCKNEYQNNRNRLHYERLQDEKYDFVQEYYKNLKNIMNIRNQKAATPLVNGASIPLKGVNLIEGGKAAVVYRYNNESDAICVFHNRGYGMQPGERGLDSSVKEIPLEQDGAFGLPNALADGTIYYDALCPANKYKVVVDKNVAKIVNTLGSSIQLGNKGIILLREKGFNGEDYFEEKQDGDKKVRAVSFHGRKTNPHVALANLKYNIR